MRAARRRPGVPRARRVPAAGSRRGMPPQRFRGVARWLADALQMNWLFAGEFQEIGQGRPGAAALTGQAILSRYALSAPAVLRSRTRRGCDGAPARGSRGAARGWRCAPRRLVCASITHTSRAARTTRSAPSNWLTSPARKRRSPRPARRGHCWRFQLRPLRPRSDARHAARPRLRGRAEQRPTTGARPSVALMRWTGSCAAARRLEWGRRRVTPDPITSRSGRGAATELHRTG